ncbi:hypothetical protein PR202_gb26638 [Eleusine coracana subsp. coracana]|uniref:Polysaccharide pyruvyl transferase domain-containing protein n=1 Tax=Eleusine coracana subsp. coracana TaxID=191504 RepID=A0AAV5FPR2_ELECO|nr:hypothetical protein PR202_gb26638 [Eleusine coracana subsp. coracana]
MGQQTPNTMTTGTYPHRHCGERLLSSVYFEEVCHLQDHNEIDQPIDRALVVITQAQRTTGKEQLIPGGEKAETSRVVCHSEGRFSESCEADGDVRVTGTALCPTTPPCTVTHATPAVLFGIGGLTGNYWHDYADVLVPLFVAARRFAGEVVFLVTNPGDRPRLLAKYGTLLKRLSKYDVVDLGGDVEVRCFPHVTVGLHMPRRSPLFPSWTLVGGFPWPISPGSNARPMSSHATRRSAWRRSRTRSRG